MDSHLLDIFIQMVMLFLVMAAGYGAKKAKIMTPQMDKDLSKLVMNVTLPGMLLAASLNAEVIPTPEQLGSTAVVACGSFVVYIAVAYILTFVLRISPGHQGVFRFMVVFGNIGFIGFPVISAIFGDEAIIYASVWQFPFNFLVFTLGIWFIVQDNDAGVKVKLNPKDFVTPALISCLLTLLFTLVGIHNVPVIGPTLNLLGSMTVPAALIIVGSSLANMPLREIIGGGRLWIASFARLLLLPIIVWAVFHFVTDNPMILGVAVALAGMPVGTNGTILCYQYGGDAKTMSQGTFITTVFCLVTIPLLMMFLG